MSTPDVAYLQSLLDQTNTLMRGINDAGILVVSVVSETTLPGDGAPNWSCVLRLRVAERSPPA